MELSHSVFVIYHNFFGFDIVYFSVAFFVYFVKKEVFSKCFFDLMYLFYNSLEKKIDN